jgi:hypothetical protein
MFRPLPKGRAALTFIVTNKSGKDPDHTLVEGPFLLNKQLKQFTATP